MRKFFIFLFVLFSLNNAFAESRFTIEEKVNRFYDRLMDLFSYDKYKDFYDEHINSHEISYDDFKNIIKSSGLTIAGSSESRLVGWDRKGKNLKITLELVYKGKNNKRERLFVNCIEKTDRIIIPIKEFKKIYTVKRSKK